MNHAIQKMPVEMVIPGPDDSSGKTNIPAPTVLPVIISDADPTGRTKFRIKDSIDFDDGKDGSILSHRDDGEKSTGFDIGTAFASLVAAKSFLRLEIGVLRP